MILTAEPESRLRHKALARGFGGNKGHVGFDPDSELIQSDEVSAGNLGDVSAATELLAELLKRARRALSRSLPGEKCRLGHRGGAARAPRCLRRQGLGPQPSTSRAGGKLA
jgi:hypothetical protein